METIERNGFTLRLEHDSAPCNPRKEFDHFGKMICWWNNYNLGDENPRMSPQDWIRKFAAGLVNAENPDLIPDEHIERILDKHAVMLPLHVYEHGGITMSTGRFSCPWDSGQAGWIYATMNQVRAEFDGDVQKATACLEAEVQEYDQFLTGDVWGYVIEDEDGYEVDSCWGFYGYAYAKGEGVAALECAAETHVPNYAI